VGFLSAVRCRIGRLHSSHVVFGSLMVQLAIPASHKTRFFSCSITANFQLTEKAVPQRTASRLRHSNRAFIADKNFED
jgi:hypothetical protein